MNQTLDEAILAMLPSKGDGKQWMSTTDVLDRLLQYGHDTYLKQVRRHLYTLQKGKKVVSMSEPEKRPVYWQRLSHLVGGYKKTEHMPASEAVAFSMLERFTRVKLPVTVLGDIDNLFTAASVRLSLDHADGRFHRAWLEKIDSVEPLFPLIRPPVDGGIFEAVKSATFWEKVIKIRYKSSKDKRENAQGHWKKVWPLALVESAGVMYLVAQDMDNPPRPEKGKAEWLRQHLRLDRIDKVEETKETFRYPADFKLDDYVNANKEFNFRVEGDPFQLRLAFSNHAGDHLLDSHVAEDQTAQWDAQGRLIVSGTVVKSLKLRWWLRSFGPDVEILEPRWWREEFAEDYRKLAEQYKVTSVAA